MPSRSKTTNPSYSVSYSTVSAFIATRISQPQHCLAPGPPCARYWQFEPCEYMRIVYLTLPWRLPQTGRSTPGAIQISSKTQERSEMTTLKRLSAMLSSWLSSAKPNVSLRVHRARESSTPFGGMSFNQEPRAPPTSIAVANASTRHEEVTL